MPDNIIFAPYFRLSMRYKKKTNLSLRRPKWRKRKDLILKDTRETVLNPGQLTRFPTPRDDNPVGELNSSLRKHAHVICCNSSQL